MSTEEEVPGTNLSRQQLTQYLVAISIVMIVWYVTQKILYFRKLPPGPWGFPFVGMMLTFLNKDILTEFKTYEKKYGKIFSFTCGNFLIIVVNDVKKGLGYLKQDEFAGRPEFEIWKIRNQGDKNRGVLLCDGNVWKEQRRVSLKCLRDFGLGKGSMEDLLQHELTELLTMMKKTADANSGTLNLQGLFNASVLNSLWQICTSKRFDLEDSNLKEIMNMFTSNLQSTSVTSPGLFMYWPVKFGLLRRKQAKDGFEMRKKMKKLLSEQIEEHRRTFSEGATRDYIDSYIEEMKTAPEGSSFHGEDGLKNLYAMLFDLFVAGAETTSTTLLWGVWFLVNNPRVQLKLAAELDQVVGDHRLPSRTDKLKLPYLDAFINETHRMCSLLPVSVFHKMMKNTYRDGFLFPKNAVVFFNLYEYHHDEEYWGDPTTFRPERFLNPEETQLLKLNALNPFSSGKRQCLGEALAKDTLFLFAAGLVQKYHFELHSQHDKCEKVIGNSNMVRMPNPFEVKITPRY